MTDGVLAEAVWTLPSAFDQDKPAQLIAVRSLLYETAFAFEDREVVFTAAEITQWAKIAKGVGAKVDCDS